MKNMKQDMEQDMIKDIWHEVTNELINNVNIIPNYYEELEGIFKKDK
jgi:hypothetical protein